VVWFNIPRFCVLTEWGIFYAGRQYLFTYFCSPINQVDLCNWVGKKIVKKWFSLIFLGKELCREKLNERHLGFLSVLWIFWDQFRCVKPCVVRFDDTDLTCKEFFDRHLGLLTKLRRDDLVVNYVQIFMIICLY
jgi:hypothetical protein